ncbi:MAG: plasmid mobilization relaxosome protein MobC [Psittacicella sp.]
MTKKQSYPTKISFRVNDSQKVKLNLLLDKSNLSISEYFRKVIDSDNKEVIIIQSKIIKTQEFRDLIYYYNKIGNNLNQITKFMNTSLKLGKTDLISYEVITVQLSQINELLKNGIEAIKAAK